MLRICILYTKKTMRKYRGWTMTVAEAAAFCPTHTKKPKTTAPPKCQAALDKATDLHMKSLDKLRGEKEGALAEAAEERESALAAMRDAAMRQASLLRQSSVATQL